MAVMSTLVGLPLALASRQASGLAGRIQLLAAVGSIGFGLWSMCHVAFENAWLPR
jgi:NO-binding membrane sensor protein with MHYT domain